MSLDLLELGPTVLAQGGDQPVIICTRKVPIISNPASTPILVYAGRCLLVGVILRAGAAEAIIRIFDSGDRNSRFPERESPGVRSATFDGYVGQTIIMDFGIVAVSDQADAIGWVLFAPLT